MIPLAHYHQNIWAKVKEFETRSEDDAYLLKVLTSGQGALVWVKMLEHGAFTCAGCLCVYLIVSYICVLRYLACIVVSMSITSQSSDRYGGSSKP